MLKITIKNHSDPEKLLDQPPPDLIGFFYDVDTSPLDMPRHIKIGARDHENDPINSYRDQVYAYDVWLEDKIKEGDAKVCGALDTIFQHALSETGITLKTKYIRPMVSPKFTHVDIIKQTIERLAKGV